MQLAVTDLEHKVFKHTLVLAHLSYIKNVETVLLRHDKRISEQSLQALLSVVLSDAVRCVSDIDFIVLGVLQDVRVQLVVREQVSDLASFVLDNVSVENLISWRQPVSALKLIEHDMHFVVLSQVVVE